MCVRGEEHTTAASRVPEPQAHGCRYIEYEQQVESLRLMRKKLRRLHGKPSLADHAGVRRVHFIFERATRKFAGDLGLWSRWLAYCRASGSTRRTSRVCSPIPSCVARTVPRARQSTEYLQCRRVCQLQCCVAAQRCPSEVLNCCYFPV